MKSLSEINASVLTPTYGSLWKRLFSFLGPAYLISVGYMDPGNWATDIEGGARFGYSLLWVLLISNLMAVLLQTLSARLGIVGRRDLAQACRESYPTAVNIPLWLLCELAIAACDLAEVIGTAIGLNLLFGLPLIWGIAITSVDTIFLLVIQRFGIRKLEAFILSLVFIVGISFLIEMILAKPDTGEVINGLIPNISKESLYVAIGILGATVMPHNLYLHSALVQSREIARTDSGIKSAIKFNLIDTVIALNAALFVNMAILILAASVFFKHGIAVTEIQQAHQLLAPLLGSSIAPTVFAIALLAAGQSSTLTGTLAGQIVMEGFLDLKMQPWARRLISRMLAVIPALIVVAAYGSAGTYKLLILSQVILSLQLPFAIIPLIHFTSDKRRMGKFSNSSLISAASWIAASFIIALNIWLVWTTFSDWLVNIGGWISVIAIPLGTGLVLLLGFMSLQPFFKKIFSIRSSKPLKIDLSGISENNNFRKIGVALEVRDSDLKILSHALPIARQSNSELVLIHIVESATAQVFDDTVGDKERIEDESYLNDIKDQIIKTGLTAKICLGFGNAAKGVTKIAKDENLDLLVLGSHGHRKLQDWILGSTVATVQHEIGQIPILVVKGT